MKKSTTKTLITQYPITIPIAVDNNLANINIDKIPIQQPSLLPDNILYKPMCYLQKEASLNYVFYAFVSVPRDSIISGHHSERINATNYITLYIDASSASRDEEMLLYVEVTGLLPPMGFQFSMVKLTVIGTDDSTDNLPRGGSGTTAVGYADADGMSA